MTPCPDETTLLAFVQGKLDETRAAGLHEHVETCAICYEVMVQALAHSTPEAHPDSKTLPATPMHPLPDVARGTSIGRYIVLDVVGRGGMGVVYAAYDPELDRKVALKLLRARPATNTHEDAEKLRGRLRREAQAMARLSHPNVVQVFDVGVADGQVFVAMELIGGTNMAAWLRVRERRAAEILSSFVEAGRGLVAAHGAGFVHRDFKPENVLIGPDGRVCVTDFGLVRTVDDPESSGGASPRQFDVSLTQPGNLVGTPAYMSPEQLRAEAADARADQFSFCLALYEALWGERAFPGADARELLRNIEAGRVRRPQRGVSPRVQRAILRGLAARPEDRFPSMAALLEELTAQPRFRKYLAPAIAGLAIASSLGLGLRLTTRPELCRDAAAQLAGVWDDPLRAGVAAHLPGAAGKTVLGTLDAYARGWQEMDTQSCQATRLRGEQSEELLDLRAQCLRQRLDELRAAANLLASDAAATSSSDAVLKTLTPISACADVSALRARSPRPRDPAIRAQVESLERRVTELKVSMTTRDATATEPLPGALDSAAARAYPPLLASLHHVRGVWLVERASFDEALVELRLAAATALAAGDDEVLIQSWARMAFIIGYEREKPDEALAWIDLAMSAQKRLVGRDDLLVGLLITRAQIDDAVNRTDDQDATVKQALALAERTLPPGDYFRVELVSLQAAVLQEREKYDESALVYQKAVDLEIAARGENSARVPVLLYNRALTLDSGHRYQEALADLERVDKLSARLAPDHPFRINQLVTLGEVDMFLGRYDAARELLERARPLVEKRKDVLPQQVFETESLLGCTYVGLHRYREAIPLLQASLPGLKNDEQIANTKAALATARAKQ